MTEPEDPTQISDFVRELTTHQQSLRAFVQYLMAGSEDAKDAVQEVNVLLWEKRAEYEMGTNFRAWCFSIARYVVLARRRQLRKDGHIVFDPDLVDRLADEWQAEPDVHLRKLAALEHCLEKLSDVDLTLVQARYTGHGKIKNLAKELDCSANSLSLRLSRLRAALKQCVRREIEVEGGSA